MDMNDINYEDQPDDQYPNPDKKIQESLEWSDKKLIEWRMSSWERY